MRTYIHKYTEHYNRCGRKNYCSLLLSGLTNSSIVPKNRNDVSMIHNNKPHYNGNKNNKNNNNYRGLWNSQHNYTSSSGRSCLRSRYNHRAPHSCHNYNHNYNYNYNGDKRRVRNPKIAEIISSALSTYPPKNDNTNQSKQSDCEEEDDKKDKEDFGRKKKGGIMIDEKSLIEIWKQLQTVPNILTLSRIFGTPLLSYCILHHMYTEALVGCFLAAGTDFLDGHVARQYPETQATVLGTYLDPMADKILINALAVSLCLDTMLPPSLVALWVLKDVGLIVTCYRAVSNQTTDGAAIMDPLRTQLKVTPTIISKINTFLQFTTVSLALLQPAILSSDLHTLSALLPPPQILDYLWYVHTHTIIHTCIHVSIV